MGLLPSSPTTADPYRQRRARVDNVHRESLAACRRHLLARRRRDGRSVRRLAPAISVGTCDERGIPRELEAGGDSPWLFIKDFSDDRDRGYRISENALTSVSVPDPGTLGLLATGLALVLMPRRRRPSRAPTRTQ